MFVALGFLLGSIALCVATSFLEATLLPALPPLLVATGLLLAVWSAPAADLARLRSLLWPIAIGAAIPALWMIVQMAPMPLAFAHPVWSSVAAGYPSPRFGALSVDIGATALALVRYLTLVGAFVLTTLLTFNRERAEAVLIALGAAATVVALLSIIFDLAGAPEREEAQSVACVGLVLTAALASYVLERHETRRAKLGMTTAKFLYPMIATAVAFVICAAAVALSRSGSLYFAAACGFGSFAALVLVRRLNLGRWGAGALAATGAVIALTLISGAAGGAEPRLAFVKKDPATVELTQRILIDTPISGSGAGTFASVTPIYASTAPDAPEPRAATAAAQLSIEMGRFMLWAALAVALLSSAWLARAASKRGRDSFFAAAAASSLVALTILAFINVSLFAPALPFLAATMLGLGVAQAQSRGA
ncbi:hypothetical protein [Methylocella sp.]|uniref:hypothetical protein n=1 Tax=Methylocella sp. TaxID=1978226 RepID=UPI0037847F3C